MIDQYSDIAWDVAGGEHVREILRTSHDIMMTSCSKRAKS